MKSVEFWGAICASLWVALSGCSRITTQVVEKPRVDQALEGGNRGYLAGSASAVGPRRQTRQMVETHIELPTPSEMTPWKIRKESPPAPEPVATSSISPMMLEEPSAPVSWEEPSMEMESAPALLERAPSTTYKVKGGDTLEKIASKVYGDSSQWRRIYNANRDRLASPNRIYPGQTLTVPVAEDQPQRASSSYK